MSSSALDRSESGPRAPRSSSGRRLRMAQYLAYAVALCIVLPAEIAQLQGRSPRNAGLLGWLYGRQMDDQTLFLLLLETRILLPLLLAAPLFWIPWRGRLRLTRLLPQGRSPLSRTEGQPRSGPSADRWAWILAALVGLTTLAVSMGIAGRPVDGVSARFGELPPAYHDEYSYLFQAETFLAGRLAFPPHPEAPELFDQMHVLNDDGVFASRYFPGVGAWIAPFLGLGHPYWGQWLAGALTAVFLFWAGRELGGNGVGALAGFLTAAAPAMGLFSNLLVSHPPALLGLSLFLFAFLRMMRTGAWGDALWAGIGLSFAMLCRPLTAAAVGFPFGIGFLLSVVRDYHTSERSNGPTDHGPRIGNNSAWKRTAALGAPLLIGLALMFFYNRALTGSGWVTPYQKYTNIYTPRHVYGFHNRIRGERNLGPKVLENYDRWAEDLTWDLALRNLRNRVVASWQWMLGLVPLAMAAVIVPIAGPGPDRRWWLVAAAIGCLHAAYFPYWYDGIMHWHYVFESGPLWLLLFAGTTQRLSRFWWTSNRFGMPVWWGLLIGAMLLTSYTAPAAWWPVSRTGLAVNQLAFSRKQYAAFRKLMKQRVTDQPALVLIESDPADRHIDYVINDPSLQGDVLYGRYRPEETDLSRLRRLFPDRALYLYRAETGELMRLRPP